MRRRSPGGRSGGSRRGTVAANVTALVVFVLFVFPVYWMVSTAFKPAGDIRTFDVKLFPHSVTLDNFRTAVSTRPGSGPTSATAWWSRCR